MVRKLAMIGFGALLPLLVGTPANSTTMVPGADTAGDFLRICSTNPSDDIKNECGASIVLIMVYNQSAVCVPKDNGGREFLPVVDNWLSAHPDAAKTDAESAIYSALIASYPCPAKSN
jgi:hypothetical protein